MSEEIDPEVLADLQLRKASEHDRTRTRTANYSWRPPEDVAHWKCRNPKCSAMVGVTQEAVDAAAVFDRELHRQRESPLDRERIAMCVECRQLFFKQRADKNRAQVDGLAGLIRELKGDPPRPDRERTLIEQIRHMHHPDVDALVQAIRERREGGKSKRKAGSL